MNPIPRPMRRQRGVAAVEPALVMPLTFPIFFALALARHGGAAGRAGRGALPVPGPGNAEITMRHAGN